MVKYYSVQYNYLINYQWGRPYRLRKGAIAPFEPILATALNSKNGAVDTHTHLALIQTM